MNKINDKLKKYQDFIYEKLNVDRIDLIHL